MLFFAASVQAAPTTSTSSSFSAAGGQPRAHMDIGGVWDGTADVSLSGNGDVFTTRLSNIIPLIPATPDLATDLSLTITLQPGFFYQPGTASVVLNGAGCGAVPTLTETSTVSPLQFDFGSGQYDLPPDCEISVRYELVAGVATTPGPKLVISQWTYSNGGPDTENQQINVLPGQSVLSFDELTQTATVNSTIDFEITVNNSGTGGLFDVAIDQSSINNNPAVGLQLILPLVELAPLDPLRVPTTNPAGDVITIPYLAPGESFIIRADATVTDCANINNTAVTTNRVPPPPDPLTAEVLLDLTVPLIDYTTITGNLSYTGPTIFTITVTNNGLGPAANVVINTNLFTPGGPAVDFVSVGAGWSHDGNGNFTLTADLGEGPGVLPNSSSVNLVITMQPTDVCTSGGGGTIEYEPSYTNSCDTPYNTPTKFSNIFDPPETPAMAVAKTASVGQLIIGSGDAGSYSVDFTATSTDLIADGGFVVNDTLPASLVNPVVTAPAGTTASCAGGPPFTGSQACSPGDLVSWTIPNPGAGNVAEALGIAFEAPTDACLGGSTLTNTATANDATSTSSCTVTGGSGSAGIQLASVPDPPSGFNPFTYSTAGGPFETGQPDDGNCSQVTGEGECIPYTASFRFPADYPGNWSDALGNTTYTDDFGGLAAQELVPGTLTIDARQGVVSLTGGPIAVPPASITQSTGQLILDLGFLTTYFPDNRVAAQSPVTEDREIILRYSTTVPDSALGGAVTLGVGSTAELLVKNAGGAPDTCATGVNDAVFTIPTGYQLERAQANVTLAAGGNPTSVDVCQVLPVTLNATNANSSQASDFLTQLLTTGSDYRFLDPPAPFFGGQFAGPGVITQDLTAPAGPVFEFTDRVLELFSGTIDLQVELSPGAAVGFGAGTPLTAAFAFDDNETTLVSVGGGFTPGRAFSGNASWTPLEVRRGDLSLQTTPQSVTVTGSSVSWQIFVTNGGNGAAYNVSIQNDIPAELGVNVAATNAANGTCSGNPITATAAGQTMSWMLDQVSPGETCEITVVADVLPSTGCSIPPNSSVITGAWGCGSPFTPVQQGAPGNPLYDDSPDFVFAQPQLLVRHESGSFCDLCDNSGEVTLLVRNVGGTRLNNVEVTEDLNTAGSGLALVANSVEVAINGGPFNPAPDPQGMPGGPYTWTQAQIPELAQLYTRSESALGPSELRIRFNVSSNEGSLPGPQLITSSALGERPCDNSVFTSPDSDFLLPVRQPDIVVAKTGDNITAGNPGTPEFVIAQPGDTVEWTVDITNQGEHTARNVRIRDILLGFPNRTAPGDTVTISGPGIPAGTTLTDVYLNAADLDDLPPNNTATYTITEALGDSCINADNQADLTWGCVVRPPGVASNLNSPSQNTDISRLVMVPDFSSPDAVQQSFTTLPGGRAEIVLTIRNDGGPADNMSIGNDLPAGIVIDQSFTPTVGGTAGQTLNSVDLTTPPHGPGNPLFVLNGPLGYGQTLVITFRVIQDGNFDTLFDPFVTPELPLATDPILPAGGPNVVDVNYSTSTACGGTPTDQDDIETFDPRTPDVDVFVSPVSELVADGAQEIYVFTIRNSGDSGSIADNIIFSLPTVGGGWTIDSVTVSSTVNGSGGACAAVAPYTCSSAQIGTLGQGEQATIDVVATPNNNGQPLTLLGQAVGNLFDDGGSDTTDDYSFDQVRPRVIGFEMRKTLLGTSEPYTPEDLPGNTAQVAIGEEAGYQLQAVFFGLDTGNGEEIRNILFRDALDLSLGHVSNDTSGSSGGVSIASVTGNPPAVLTPGVAVISGELDFNLNDITTAGGGTFDAQLGTRFLNNGRSNGDTLSNNFDGEFEVFFTPSVSQLFRSAAFGGTDPELHADATLTAALPELTFNKQIRNITKGGGFVEGSPPLDVEGTDVVEYRITIANAATGSAPLFDLIVDDTLATSKILLDTTPGSFGADTTGDDIVDVPGGVITPGPPDQIVFDQGGLVLPPGQSLAQLDPGQTITLLYRGTVQTTVNPVEILNNNARLTDAWSLPDNDGDAALHDGNQTNGLEGDPDDTDGAENFTASDVASAIVENSTAIAKTAGGSILGNGADGDRDYRVGDIITYTLAVTLTPLATIDNFVLSDDLTGAPGLVFTGAAPVITLQNVTAQFPNPSGPLAGATSHAWDFGQVVVNADNNAIRIEYAVQVTDVVALPLGDLENLRNNATVSFDTAGPPFSQSTYANIDVPQPNLVASKVSVPAAPATVDEGDPIQYTVTLTNTGAAPAYDTVVRDIIPDGVRAAADAAGTIPATITIRDSGGAVVYASAVDKDGVFPGTFLSDGEVQWDFDEGTAADTIPAGGTLELVYTVTVDTNIGAGVQLTNAARANAYHSLDDDDLPPNVVLDDRRTYAPSNEAQTTLFTVSPGNLSKDNPAPPRATIGEPFDYLMILPATGNTVEVKLYDVEISDTLPDELSFVSVTADVPPSTWDLENTGAGNNLLIQDITNNGVDIPPNAQIEVTLRARVNNTPAENIGGTFSNSASYAFASSEGGAVDQSGGPAVITPPMTIVEPEITPAKEVRNVSAGDVFGAPPTAPNAGDILEYRIALNAGGGVNNSDAFDIEVADNLPAGVDYIPGTSAIGAGSFAGGSAADNQFSEPAVAGPSLVWAYSEAPGAEIDIDVPVGQTVYLLYQVLVLDSVLPLQTLQNSALITWTSLDGEGPDEQLYQRDGSDLSGGPNDYYAWISASIDVADSTQISKTEASVAPLGNGTPDDGDGNYRIGDVVTYRIEITDLTEATLNNTVVADLLPVGLAYINGSSTITHNGGILPDPTAVLPTTSGTGGPGDPQTITWDFGNIVNPGDDPDSTRPDTITITYDVQVLETAVATNDALNTGTASYDTGPGVANHSDTATIDIVLPALTVTKTSTAGPTVVAGEVVPYDVTITNNGLAPAYDVLVRDIIPVGMRIAADAAGTIPATVTIRDGGGAITHGPVVKNGVFPGVFLTDGTVEWNFDEGNGAADVLPAGGTLVLQYDVQVDLNVAPGATLANSVLVQVHWSIDDDDIPPGGIPYPFPPTPPDDVVLTTRTPGVMSKTSATVESTMGDTIVYTLRIPDAQFGAALFDVVVQDQLPPNVEFLGAAYGPGNVVTDPLVASVDGFNLLTLTSNPDGFDIPASGVAVIEVTVRHNDVNGGVAGDTFTNSATYTWENREDGTDDFSGGVAAGYAITVVEPELIARKTGPPNIDINGAAFTLEIENTGRAAAWDATVVDLLPPEMDDNPPVVNAVEIVDSFGGTRALTLGTDYSYSYAGGVMTFTMSSANAAIGRANPPASPPGTLGEILRIQYTGFLDDNVVNGTLLTNVAGATQWYTQDTTGGVAPPDTRVYNRVLTDGTVGVIDHEDAYTITVAAPIITFTKDVDLRAAQAGDTLTYTIVITNSGGAEGGVDFTDDLGALDADDVYLPNSLVVITPPIGAGSSTVTPNGGTNNKGLLEYTDIPVAAGGSQTIVFSVGTRPVVTAGDIASNQAALAVAGFTATIPSDDPVTPAPDDPTITVFDAAPDFIVEKVDTDLTGDPNLLQIGDTLRYTITVTNIGSEDSVNTVLTDLIPANTSYVAGSTRLNGVVVADLGAAPNPISPLEQGLLINDSASAATPGLVTAGSGVSASVTFDVTVNQGLLSGTILSNQASLTGQGSGSGVFSARVSDDPDTAILNDPTQSVVGAGTIVDAQKTVSAEPSPVQSGPAPPSSVLTYTITVTNNGNIPATGVVVTDNIPANTTYVADSTTLNGVPVPDPAANVSQLESAQGGLDVNSSDLTPPAPLPGSGLGQLSPGASAVITFQVRVDDGVADGTVISNQGEVSTNEQPLEPTDADGNDENGDQPTEIIVGGVPTLQITKEVFVVGGGTATSPGQLEYVIQVVNAGAVDATNAVMTDNLDLPVAGLIDYVAGSGTINGSPAGISFVDPVLTAAFGTLEPGESAQVRFRVDIVPGLNAGTAIENSARVVADGGVDETDSANIDVGGAPGVANMNGNVWLDANHDDVFDIGTEDPEQGWAVQVFLNGNLVDGVISDTNGAYALNGLAPGATYEIRFSFPGSTILQGDTAPAPGYGNPGPQVITNITTLAAGNNVLDQNMPVDANGVVYDSISGQPVAGATLTLLNAATGNPVPGACFDDPQHQGQVTAGNGHYLFALNFSDPSCPAGGDYVIEITSPVSGYEAAPSTIILPTTDSTTTPYDVPTCPADQVAPSPPAGTCEAQPQATAPNIGGSPPPDTTYYLHLTFTNVTANADQIYNNHIPLDPELSGAVALSKTTPKVNVVRGDLVPYTITATNNLSGPLSGTRITDTIPPGFKYVKGSAKLDGVKTEPAINGLALSWDGLTLEAGDPLVIKIILIIGAGVGEGEYVNKVDLFNTTIGDPSSPVATATATVRVVPDPTFDCTDIIGKVFDDKNANGYQDKGEPGLPGVRLSTTQGLLITTDEHGRYHVTCAAVPNRDRGSNFIIKLDERSLPAGYRLTTENPRVQHVTRGKMAKFNFGAAIHRVVRLDMSDAAFLPAKAVLRPEWSDTLDTLIEQLRREPSVLRLSYLGDAESARLAKRRIKHIKGVIEKKWKALNCCYDLTIETELFWRRGRPGGKR